jgi:arylsulfatase
MPGLRSQFAHLNDIAPTLYEIAGITLPETVNGVRQAPPLEGSSLAYTFENPNEPSHHHVQYFATSGNRAIYKDGWWAGDRLRSTWEPNGIAGGESEVPTDTDIHPWEFYNLSEDYSQAHDLAAKNPEKLKELQALFDAEAKRNQVYPLLPAYGHLPTAQQAGKKHFVYRDGVDRLTARVAPAVAGKHFTITADVDTKASATDGVIVAHGSRYGGYTLFVKGGRVQFAVNAFGNDAGHVIASAPLPAGHSQIVVEVIPDGNRQDTTPLNTVSFAVRGALGGTATISVNGRQEGQAHLENINFTANETLDIGKDLGSAVSREYSSPYLFAGKIEKVTVDLR